MTRFLLKQVTFGSPLLLRTGTLHFSSILTIVHDVALCNMKHRGKARQCPNPPTGSSLLDHVATQSMATAASRNQSVYLVLKRNAAGGGKMCPGLCGTAVTYSLYFYSLAL
jgi:hypothetical protein